MATRTALLNGNVINRDTDFSKHIEAVSEPGVISGFAVSSSSVAVGQALVKCERTNGDTIYAVVYNNSAQEINGDGDVFIEIPQELIDNGELMNEDGSEIAEIKVGTMPSKNALKLATKSGDTITDARNMIKKSGELLALINQNIEDISDLDDRVEALEEAEAIDHLEESGLVGELYTLSDKLFKQYTPALADSTVDCNVSNTSANSQIHIQRIGSGIASNQLKLKVKMVGSSTQNLKVEVRKGVQVTVTEGVEAYWYGNQVIASGSIPYSDISSSYTEKTITLDNNFGGTRGELLDIVVYMDTVNASNYYCVACDGTQYSEGFSYVAVNGNTRVRSKYMPYGISNGFEESMLNKYISNPNVYFTIATNNTQSSANTVGTVVATYTVPYDGNAKINGDVYTTGAGQYIVKLNGTSVGNAWYIWDYSGRGNYTTNVSNVKKGDIITIVVDGVSGYGITYYSSSFELAPVSKGYKLIPNSLFALGELGTGTLFGMNNKVFRGGIITGDGTTAKTGSITLGNAVGYLEVDYNGTVVRVPYYK